MSSATRNGPEDWRNVQSPDTRGAFGKLRRMVIGVTSRVLWQVLGHTALDGRRESRDAEVFGGAGVFARPGGRNAEAFVIFPGEGAISPIVVAVRDEQMRAALVAVLTGGLKQGEVALASGSDGTVAALVHVKADGTVEVRTPTGTAKALVTFETFARHTHATAGSGSPVGPTPLTGGALAGTDVIKGE